MACCINFSHVPLKSVKQNRQDTVDRYEKTGDLEPPGGGFTLAMGFTDFSLLLMSAIKNRFCWDIRTLKSILNSAHILKHICYNVMMHIATHIQYIPFFLQLIHSKNSSCLRRPKGARLGSCSPVLPRTADVDSRGITLACPGTQLSRRRPLEVRWQDQKPKGLSFVFWKFWMVSVYNGCSTQSSTRQPWITHDF